MDSTAVIAITGILAASIVGPVLISVLTHRQRRAERIEDYARQDQVAEAAAARDRASIARTDEVARLAAESASATDGKLNQIHELVNSTLTGAMQSQLVAKEALLAMIRRFEPDQDREIALLEGEIAELRAALADRASSTAIADAQLETPRADKHTTRA